ncbi:putative thymidylate kinase [Crocosphaera subtropica ATCC 51142]|uniref:Thymidylate kinase n=1 Tax=Crocosphaera subtropica (strain ATCC 51142 / BH68) TaxID=43989 RepID=B1WUS3_CROS5|nr:dTMP kinase [Crocosphaera subtropica]ACB50524.1 putative thymidylate kinase [Crocosphaera subtropica ATCC 51142]
MQPLFIVLEGIDKAGKTTQAERLKRYLINQGDSAIISSEPTEGVIGELIRKAMQSPVFKINDKAKFDQQMAYLFAADRHYHLYNEVDGVYKLIQQDHYHVIATRYYFSSLAYNSNNQEEFNFVYGLNKRFPNPDLVIYLDIPLDIALSRLENTHDKEVYETKEKLQQVQDNYQQIFQSYKGQILTIDGKNNIEQIHQEIITYLEKQFS